MWWFLLWACRADPDGPGSGVPCAERVQGAALPGRLAVEAPDCGAYEAALVVEGAGEHAIDGFVFGDVTVPLIRGLSPEATVRAVEARGPFEVAGGEPLIAWDLGLDSVVAARIGEPGGTAGWASALARADGGVLLVGAVTAETALVTVRVDGDDLVVRWDLGAEIALGDGGELTVDPVVALLAPDLPDAWAAWADGVAAQRGAKGVGEAPPVAWDDDGGPVPEGVGAVFRVDGGPDDLIESGWVPGRRLRPLEVAAGDPVLVEHPDWWLPGQDPPVLDVTAPGAGDWLEARIASEVAAGWRALVVEGLGRALAAPSRGAGTALEAHALALDRVAEGAGRAWVAVDGPELTAIGRVDAVVGAAGDPAARLADRAVRAALTPWIVTWGPAAGASPPALAGAMVGGGGWVAAAAVPSADILSFREEAWSARAGDDGLLWFEGAAGGVVVHNPGGAAVELDDVGPDLLGTGEGTVIPPGGARAWRRTGAE